MSGWLDLIDIGLDAAQTYQIYKAREDLKQIQAGAQAEAARKLVLEVVRNFVFEIAQDIRALEEHLQTAPQQVYVVARALEWRLQDSGVSPEIFAEFTDKEYVQQTLTRIKSAIQQSRGRLSTEQLNQAEAAISYITQAGLLKQAIEAKTALEELQATEPEWQALSQQVKSASTNKSLGCLALLATLSIVPAILVALVAMLEHLSKFMGGVGWLFTIIIVIVCLVGAIYLMVKGAKPARYKQLKGIREDLQKKLLSREIWEQVAGLWGDQPSQGYRNIQAARGNFLRGIFGQIEGFDKFLPAGS